MQGKLVNYLLGSLEEDERLKLEARLLIDQELQAELSFMRECMGLNIEEQVSSNRSFSDPKNLSPTDETEESFATFCGSSEQDAEEDLSEEFPTDLTERTMCCVVESSCGVGPSSKTGSSETTASEATSSETTSLSETLAVGPNVTPHGLPLTKHAPSLSHPHHHTPAAMSCCPAGAKCGEPNTHRWQLSDLAVGAGLLLIFTALFSQIAISQREDSRQFACQNNLRQLHQSLVQYAEQYDGYYPRINPGENAGMYMVQLVDRGFLTQDHARELAMCASSPQIEKIATYYVPSLLEMSNAPMHRVTLWKKEAGGSYAYRLGYMNNGIYQHIKDRGNSRIPLMADAPNTSLANDKTHGCTMNFLYQDGSVRSQQSCYCHEGSHLFLNDLNQEAAGLNFKDVVLAPSEVEPHIHLITIELGTTNQQQTSL